MSRWSWCGGGGRSGGRGGRWHCLVLALVAPPLAVLVLGVGVALPVIAARGPAQSWHSLVLALVAPPLVVLVLGVGVALHGVVCVCACDRVAPPPRMLKFRRQIQQFGITREWQSFCCAQKLTITHVFAWCIPYGCTPMRLLVHCECCVHREQRSTTSRQLSKPVSGHLARGDKETHQVILCARCTRLGSTSDKQCVDAKANADQESRQPLQHERRCLLHIHLITAAVAAKQQILSERQRF